MLFGRRILLAVTGGIAAYKSCELLRLLVKNGASVRVAMTAAATRFVGPTTYAALSGQDVATDLFSLDESRSGHLGIVRDIDMMVIAPATANCIAKLANGIADDLVSTAALALNAPLLVCPAMNPKMYAHPAVQDNLERLSRRGVLIIEPEEGSMAGPREAPGIGRLPEPERICDRICRELPPSGPLKGVSITVTAGPTREAIDPVRVISNLSSGKTGYALAAEARRRGADVHLISGPVFLSRPFGIDVESVESTHQLLTALKERFDDTRVLIMAAAPSDFRPAEPSSGKLKKKNVEDNFTLTLEKNPDILAELSKTKRDQLLIGFALETNDGLKNAGEKLKDKHLDVIVLNHPGASPDTGIGKDAIQATIIFADGTVEELPATTKSEFARTLLDTVQKLLLK